MNWTIRVSGPGSIQSVDLIRVQVTLHRVDHNLISLTPVDRAEIALLKNIWQPTVKTKTSLLGRGHDLDSGEVGEQSPSLNRVDTVSVD